MLTQSLDSAVWGGSTEGSNLDSAGGFSGSAVIASRGLLSGCLSTRSGSAKKKLYTSNFTL